jgi:hypothetical protein
MDMLIDGIAWCVAQCGFNTDFVGALPHGLHEAAQRQRCPRLMLEAMKKIMAPTRS